MGLVCVALRVHNYYLCATCVIVNMCPCVYLLASWCMHNNLTCVLLVCTVYMFMSKCSLKLLARPGTSTPLTTLTAAVAFGLAAANGSGGVCVCVCVCVCDHGCVKVCMCVL